MVINSKCSEVQNSCSGHNTTNNVLISLLDRTTVLWVWLIARSMIPNLLVCYLWSECLGDGHPCLLLWLESVSGSWALLSPWLTCWYDWGPYLAHELIAVHWPPTFWSLLCLWCMCPVQCLQHCLLIGLKIKLKSVLAHINSGNRESLFKEDLLVSSSTLLDL